MVLLSSRTYLLTPEIFIIWKLKTGAGNEVQLTDAIDTR